MTGRHSKPGRAALEGCDAFLKHRVGGISDPRIDVAESLQAKQ